MRRWAGWSSLALVTCADGFVPGLGPLVRPQTHSNEERGAQHGGSLEVAKTVVEEQGYLTWLSQKVEKSNRPPPVKIRRARLTRDFAVLLMRSSYQVCDDLDFIPMDEFQKKFFLLRQGEWSDYKEQFPTIKQGDLTDPDYFDFISFAQYASIAEAMRNGRDIFEEKVGAEGEKRTVQRNPDFTDNALLPAEHAKRVGDKILTYCTETFRSTKLAPVVDAGLSMAVLAEGCDRIMNLLRLNFYMLDYTVSSDPGRRTLVRVGAHRSKVQVIQAIHTPQDKSEGDCAGNNMGAAGIGKKKRPTCKRFRSEGIDGLSTSMRARERNVFHQD